MTRISLLVPTRGRPERLRQMISSLVATVRFPQAMELVLLVDGDDTSMSSFKAEAPFDVRIVVGVPGRSMGEMNRDCYEVSTGDWVMLTNDDVIVRTTGWDEVLRFQMATASDGIALLHVNDNLFESSLCTFPCVSRRFVSLVGEICPAEYRRYRIDDHIFHIFGLLAFLGWKRIFYLPKVIFDHQNRSTQTGQYEANPLIMEQDAATFDELGPRRIEAVVSLISMLDETADLASIRRRLERAPPAFSLRRRRFLRVVGHDPSAPSVLRRAYGFLRGRLVSAVRARKRSSSGA